MTTNNGFKSVRELDRSSADYIKNLETGYVGLNRFLETKKQALEVMYSELGETLVKDLKHHLGLQVRSVQPGTVPLEQIPLEIRRRLEVLGLPNIELVFEGEQQFSDDLNRKTGRIFRRRFGENRQVRSTLEEEIKMANDSFFDYTIALLGLFCYGSLTFDPKVTRKHNHFYMVRKGEGFVYEGHFEMPDAGKLSPVDLGKRLREGPYVNSMITPDMFRDEKFLDALRKGYEAADTNAFLIRTPAAVLPPGFDMEFAVVGILSDMLGHHIGIEGLRERINRVATNLYYARTRR